MADITAKVPESGSVDRILKVTFWVFLVLVAVYVICEYSIRSSRKYPVSVQRGVRQMLEQSINDSTSSLQDQDALRSLVNSTKAVATIEAALKVCHQEDMEPLTGVHFDEAYDNAYKSQKQALERMKTKKD